MARHRALALALVACAVLGALGASFPSPPPPSPAPPSPAPPSPAPPSPSPPAGTAPPQPYNIDVCPNAKWKDLPFLDGPSSQEKISNITKWKKADWDEYVTGTIVPQAGASIAFVALALLALILFLFWRLIRRCCLCYAYCCCRPCCGEDPNVDPKAAVSGWVFWLLKIATILLCVASACVMLAGAATADKTLITRMWVPIDHFTNYFANMTNALTSLVEGLNDVNPIVNNFTRLANVDINFSALKADLTAVGTYLDLPAANPATMNTALVTLSVTVTKLRTDMPAVRATLVTLQPDVSTWAKGMNWWAAAVTTLGTTYAGNLNTLSTSLTAINGGTFPLAAATVSAMNDALAGLPLSTYITALGNAIASIDLMKSWKASNTIGALADSLTSLSNTMDSLKGGQATAAATSLNAFFTAYNNFNATFTRLVQRMDSIQTNVIALDAATNSAFDKIRAVQQNVSALMTMSPNAQQLATNLTALATQFDLGQISTIIANLNFLDQALDNTMSTSVVDGARDQALNVKTKFEVLQAKLDPTTTAFNTFKNSQTQANFDALKATTSGSGNTAELTSTASTASTTASDNANVIAMQAFVTSNNLNTRADTLSANIAAQITAIDTATSTLNGRVPPSLTPYTTLTASLNTNFAGMPVPKSGQVAPVITTLNKVEEDIVTVPDQVTTAATDVQADFNPGIDKLNSSIVIKLEKFRTNQTSNVENADNQRYIADVILFAISIVLLVALIVFVVINCPWGVVLLIVCLLIMVILMFILSAIFAFLLAFAQDGCYHTEYVVVAATGNTSNVKPLLEYYFFGDNSTNVKVVLKDSDLVDVDQVTASVTGQINSTESDIRAQYNPKQRLTDVFTSVHDFINNTETRINVILDLASVFSVRPLYIDVKVFPCCDVADYFGHMWNMLTAGSWLILITLVVTMVFLSRLDMLPLSCCGCAPMCPGGSSDKVHPVSGDGEEGAKAVVLDPPRDQAIAATGGDAAAAGSTVVVVAAPPPAYPPGAYAPEQDPYAQPSAPPPPPVAPPPPPVERPQSGSFGAVEPMGSSPGGAHTAASPAGERPHSSTKPGSAGRQEGWGQVESFNNDSLRARN